MTGKRTRVGGLGSRVQGSEVRVAGEVIGKQSKGLGNAPGARWATGHNLGRKLWGVHKGYTVG